MIENYSIEIDFLPVGEESKCGDAIALRFGLYEAGLWKNQTIFIIDGGNSNSGDALVKHVKEVYKSDKVDRVILTHPDGDHASGLRNVVEQLNVGKIWMHRPWHYWGDLKDSIVDGRITKKSFTETLREAYQYAHNIEQLAIQKKIEIFHPHQGRSFAIHDENILTVLGPPKELYLSLIQASGKTPEMGVFESVSKSFTTPGKELAFEDMSFETEHLADSDAATSAENDMSLILLLKVGGSKVLFTGDAGTQGLYKAIKYTIEKGISLKDLALFDVPHHGSRHNLSKGILEYINAKYSIISCSKKGEPSHPSPIVTNSLLRRNMNPHWTKGTLINYHDGDVPMRVGLVPIAPIPFSNHVEIPDDEK
jgi:beta-lactamase superfamily II metal-dependent hydrolase